jgi:hypothetical protein
MINVTRRGLIGSIGALFVAPAIVRAESLMKVKPVLTGGAENLWGEVYCRTTAAPTIVRCDTGEGKFMEFVGFDAYGAVIREVVSLSNGSARTSKTFKQLTSISSWNSATGPFTMVSIGAHE